LNGQHIVEIDGNNAVGTSYCLITMISNNDRKGTKTTIKAIYFDDYVRQNNWWQIAKRIGSFIT
jgi:hypothetical protein